MGARVEVETSELDDDDAHARGGLIVAHFRLDAGGRLIRALGLGAAIMALGCSALGVAVLYPSFDPNSDVRLTRIPVGAVTATGEPIHHQSPLYEVMFGVFGFLCVGGACAITLRRLHNLLREESYLVLRTDGAFFRQADRRAYIAWEDTETVVWDAEAEAIRFQRHDGSAWLRDERYAGIEGPELAKCARDVRRKALFGLL